MSSDWIKLHRKSLDSRVFSDPDLWQLFCWCLMKANWKDGWFESEMVPAGSFVTGRESASMLLKTNPSTWYKRIKKLEKLGVISIKSNNRFTLITVVKWGDYQDSSLDGNNEVTTKEQRSNNEVTTKEQRSNTIEEGKESKEGEERKKKSVVSKPDDVDQETWDGWLAVRKSKRSPAITERIISSNRKEAGKAGWTLQQALDKCVHRGWVAFEADWVAGDASRKNTKQTETRSDDERDAIVDSIFGPRT